MKAMKVFLLISALGVAVFSQDNGYENDDDDGEEDIYGSGETTSEPTAGNNSSSLPSSAANHSPQRGAVVTKYSLCLLPVILNLCMKA